MRSLIKHVSSVVALLFFVSVFVGVPARLVSAAVTDPTDPLSSACNITPDSEICQKRAQNQGNTVSGTKGIILKVSNIVAVITGIAAVITVALAGFRYVTSQGDPKSIAGAKDQIIYAMVGVVVVVVARSIIVFVINKL